MIWLHGVSIGESLANLTLAKALLEIYPKQKILLTSTTKTSEALLRKATNDRIFYDKYPIDLPWRINSFLDKWQPDFAVFGESELWPVMLKAIRKRNISTVLINARLSKRSFKRWKMLGFLIKPMLKTFSLILAQSDEENERYKQLGASKVITTGNLKFSTPPLEFDANQLEKLKQQINNRPIVLFSSTHAPEEQLAVEIHNNLKQNFSNLLSIIIPRHPERGGNIAENIDIEISQRSLNQPIDDNTEIYLADTLGETGLFYKLCPIVFLGNSLTKTPGGGHNPIEPAHLDCAIVYGSEMFNFKLIDSEMQNSQAVIKCNSLEEVTQNLGLLLKYADKVSKLSKNAKNYAQSKSTVLPDILEKLTPLIDTAIHEST